MRIYVNGKNIEITDAIKAYVREKIGKVVNHYDQVQGIEVILEVIKNPSAAGKFIAEVACKLNNGVIRVEESADSMYASIDLLSDKLLRQVKKFKDKALSSKDKTASIRTNAIGSEEDEDEDEIVVEAIED